MVKYLRPAQILKIWGTQRDHQKDDKPGQVTGLPLSGSRMPRTPTKKGPKGDWEANFVEKKWNATNKKIGIEHEYLKNMIILLRKKYHEIVGLVDDAWFY
jgi:hypothetical protein